MTSLVEFLFPAPARRSAGSIVTWWERRRIAYNLVVGSAGVVGVALGTVLASLPPGGLGWLVLPPWQPIVVFGVLANVCYFLGPVTELLIDRLWGRQILPTGPALFRMGLTFSVGLALLPALLMMIGWVFRVVAWVF